MDTHLETEVQKQLERAKIELHDVDESISKLTGHPAYLGSNPNVFKRRRLNRSGNESFNNRHYQENKNTIEQGEYEDIAKKKVPSLASRSDVDLHAREKMIQMQRSDVENVNRSRRMFGALLGTLNKFRVEEMKLRDKENKKAEVERKLEEKAREEKMKVWQNKQMALETRKRKQQKIRVLELKSERVSEYKEWEIRQLCLANFARTKTKPCLCFQPKLPHPSVDLCIEATRVLIENAIQIRREHLDKNMTMLDERVRRLEYINTDKHKDILSHSHDVSAVKSALGDAPNAGVDRPPEEVDLNTQPAVVSGGSPPDMNSAELDGFMENCDDDVFNDLELNAGFELNDPVDGPNCDLSSKTDPAPQLSTDRCDEAVPRPSDAAYDSDSNRIVRTIRKVDSISVQITNDSFSVHEESSDFGPEADVISDSNTKNCCKDNLSINVDISGDEFDKPIGAKFSVKSTTNIEEMSIDNSDTLKSSYGLIGAESSNESDTESDASHQEQDMKRNILSEGKRTHRSKNVNTTHAAKEHSNFIRSGIRMGQKSSGDSSESDSSSADSSQRTGRRGCRTDSAPKLARNTRDCSRERAVDVSQHHARRRDRSPIPGQVRVSRERLTLSGGHRRERTADRRMLLSSSKNRDKIRRRSGSHHSFTS